MNIDKTKVMRNGKGSGDIVKTGKWACAACCVCGPLEPHQNNTQ